jgi:hypothetical protein
VDAIVRPLGLVSADAGSHIRAKETRVGGAREMSVYKGDLSPFFLTSNQSQLNSWWFKWCVILCFFPTGLLGSWLEVHYKRGGAGRGGEERGGVGRGGVGRGGEGRGGEERGGGGEGRGGGGEVF